MIGTMLVLTADLREPARAADRRPGPPPIILFHFAVGGPLELVQGFDSIANEGEIFECIAFRHERPPAGALFNALATLAWHRARQRAGSTLVGFDGRFVDELLGNVVVTFGDRDYMAALAALSPLGGLGNGENSGPARGSGRGVA